MSAVSIDRVERNRAQETFESHADDAFQSLTNRIEGLGRTLDGAAALFAASENVTAQDWQQYVTMLDIENALPGILGVGFITALQERDGVPISEQVQQLGPDFPTIHPDTGRSEKFVIQYIEPLATNRAALGLDIAFEEGRRTAAQRARETNTIQLTPPIELVQDNELKAGFLLLRPFYEMGFDSSDAQATQEAFRGWVFMPFVGEALFEPLSSHLERIADLTVFDGDVGNANAAIYSDLPGTTSSKPYFNVTREIEIFGRNWTLVWHSTVEFQEGKIGPLRWIIAVFVMIIFGLIAQISRDVEIRERRIQIDVDRKTEELRAKSEETHSVIENAVMAIIVVDEDKNIVSANQAAMALFKAAPLKIGMPIQDLISVRSRRANENRTADRASCPAIPNLRLKVQVNEWTTADGATRSTLLVQDDTEAEASARRLRENEARWNLAMEGAQIGVFDLDLVTNQSVVSDTWRKLMDVPLDAPEQDFQKLFISRIHPDDLPIVSAANKRCIDGTAERSTAEYRMRFEDGSTRWMKSDAVVVTRDASGKALRFIGAQMDVTALREARDALRSSRERFEVLLEQAPVGMALVAKDGRFLGTNEALCRMTGYTAQEMQDSLRFRHLISPNEFMTLLRTVDALKTQERSSYQNEHLVILKNGPPIWGLFSVAWTYDEAKDEEIFIVQIQDITEKKNIERMKSEFVATVSHELRTPLTSIKGAIGLLRGPMLEKMPTGAGRLLEIAGSNTDRLSALVNDILDLEKIRSGEVDFHIEPTDLVKLISDSVEQMLPFAVQHKVEFRLSVPQEAVNAMIDPQRTQQVVTNLLSNACKYSDDDTKVHIRLEMVDDDALVCVLNTGPVISDEFKKQIFRPFSQADSTDTRSTGGTGLGLNISRQIVERMDGKIGFTSEVGAPTAFWFTVPLEHVEREPAPVIPLHSTSPKKFRVLHLEDDSDFSEIIRKGLGDLAHMTSVLTVAQARAAVLSEPFDLIVIDWDLPDGNCRDILDVVKKYQPDARIMSLSATETRVRDLRVDHEMVKSEQNLDEIVAKMVKYS